MTTVQKETVIKLDGKEYKVQFPNIGQYIRIEALKQSLSQGRYAIMAWSGLESSTKALDLVDAISYFSIIIGDDFRKHFGVENDADLLELPMDKGEGLIKAYTEQFAPFYNVISKREDRPEVEEPKAKG